MAPQEPPKPVFDSCDEVSVTVKCWEEQAAPEPNVAYRIEYKEYPEVRIQPARNSSVQRREAPARRGAGMEGREISRSRTTARRTHQRDLR